MTTGRPALDPLRVPPGKGFIVPIHRPMIQPARPPPAANSVHVPNPSNFVSYIHKPNKISILSKKSDFPRSIPSRFPSADWQKIRNYTQPIRKHMGVDKLFGINRLDKRYAEYAGYAAREQKRESNSGPEEESDQGRPPWKRRSTTAFRFHQPGGIDKTGGDRPDHENRRRDFRKGIEAKKIYVISKSDLAQAVQQG